MIRDASGCSGSVVATVGAIRDEVAAAVGIAGICALVASIATAIKLARGSTIRTPTEARSLASVGTSHILGPVISSGCRTTDLNVIAGTSVFSRITFVAIRGRAAFAAIIFHASVGTGARRPRVVGVAIASVDTTASTARHIVQVVSTAIIAFTHCGRAVHVTAVATTA